MFDLKGEKIHFEWFSSQINIVQPCIINARKIVQFLLSNLCMCDKMANYVDTYVQLECSAMKCKFVIQIHVAAFGKSKFNLPSHSRIHYNFAAIS